MRAKRTFSLILRLTFLLFPAISLAVDIVAKPLARLPAVAPGWKISLVAEAPQILFPTAIVCGGDGTIYLGQDPMDMPGPPTEPIDSVVALKDGKLTLFADRLWAVMGLEWVDDTLYVVHAPFLSAFRDTNGDGRADQRTDLITGLGPKLPGFSGINDHIASGVRLGMDGFLYIAVGDKGIPKGVGKDGAVIQLFGGGVIRVRPDGTGLEVVSSGERNPLSVALTRSDDIFTYGNDDDSKRWPNSLTHHILGAHFGYPYEFETAPDRTLPIVDGQFGGSGAQGLCYNEDRIPGLRGNLLFCDWGLQSVIRYKIEPRGATFAATSKTSLVTKGALTDFRPFSVAVSNDHASLYLVDWAYTGWLANGPKTGRLFRLESTEPLNDRIYPSRSMISMLDDDSYATRLRSQRLLVHSGDAQVESLIKRLQQRTAGDVKSESSEPTSGQIHALWALDAINTPAARSAIRNALHFPLEMVEARREAARSSGIRRDREAISALISLLNDRAPTVRREAAIALGRMGDKSIAPSLMSALGDPDPFVAWSVRHAIRSLNAYDARLLSEALLDRKRQADALKLCDQAWTQAVVDALTLTLPKIKPAPARARLVAILAGLYRKYPAWSGAWFGTNPLAGRFPQQTAAWDERAMADIQAGLSVACGDPDAKVRLQAIAGLIIVGKPALPTLRAALASEPEPTNLAALAKGLGVLQDFSAAPSLGAILQDANKPEPTRLAALDALSSLRGPQALTARISLVYDPKAPSTLIARALPSLGREGIVPPNDLAGFLENESPAVRASALSALIARKKLPQGVKDLVLARLDDPDLNVRKSAFEAVVTVKLREAVPRLLTAALKEPTRNDAIFALTSMPDPTALPVYLSALSDRNADIRKAAESALIAIRDSIGPDLEKAAKSAHYEGPAALALERVLTRFAPITAWKVIGPFARTTGNGFVEERSIDFGKTYAGALGRKISWVSGKADPADGRVVIDAFKAGAGDRGGFGYDTNGSPDLCAFAYAEISSNGDRDAFFKVGSSGSATVTLNEEIVLAYRNFAGRAYQPDSDFIRVALKKGINRILVQTRQGIGVWSFGVQVSEPSSIVVAGASQGRGAGLEALRAFALSREGDPRSGEALFFDAKGVGCVKCHAAGGKGTQGIGPDLTGLALKYDKTEVIRSVLEPSARLANGYQPVLLATRDGKVVAGLIRDETDAHINLVDSETKVFRVLKSEIEERKVGDFSIMPANLADSLTVVEFADLISYLQTLKQAASSKIKY